MKTLVAFSLLFMLALVAVPAAAEEHPDPITVAPDHYKVVMENDRVRVLEFMGKAGDKVAEHWHPDHVVYTVNGGAAKFTADGKTMEQEMKSGSTHYIPGGAHASEISRGDKVHVIIVELKDGPAKP